VNPLTAATMMPDNADQIPGSLEDWLARPAWHADALCKGETALYFSRRASKAAATCQRCPVRQPCLDTAMADSDLEGVWGGFTEKKRRQLRRAVA
jgi:WhiB family transcriptional regulator, redox-sensing transcriptional regulator